MKPKRYFRRELKYKFPYDEIGGVYFLLKGNKVVYIGQTMNIVSRLASHGNKDFDKFRLIQCRWCDMRYYEARLIILFRPKYNINGFKKTGRQYVRRVE